MSVTNLFPYFLWMMAYVLFGAVIVRLWPFYRRLVDEKLADPAYHQGLEGLRGFLALSVFFHHSVITYFYLQTGRWELPPSRFYSLLGSTAVLLFFFLTGFLFWLRLLKNPQVAVRSFYLKRIKRLFPAYLSALLAITVIIFAESQWRLDTSLIQLVGSLFQWAVMGIPFGHFPAINGYSGTNTVNAGVEWTLRYELLFYLALPFLARFAKPGKFFRLIFGALIFYLVLRAFAPAFHSLNVWIEIFKFFLIGFAFGMWAAILYSNARLRRLSQSGWGLGLATLALLLIFFFVPKGGYDFQESILLFVFFVIVSQRGDFWRILRTRGAVFLGLISYSLYLIHGIVLFGMTQIFVKGRLPNMSVELYWLMIGVTGALAVLVCSIVYRYIESPFLKRSSPASRSA